MEICDSNEVSIPIVELAVLPKEAIHVRAGKAESKVFP